MLDRDRLLLGGGVSRSELLFMLLRIFTVMRCLSFAVPIINQSSCGAGRGERRGDCFGFGERTTFHTGTGNGGVLPESESQESGLGALARGRKGPLQVAQALRPTPPLPHLRVTTSNIKSSSTVVSAVE